MDTTHRDDNCLKTSYTRTYLGHEAFDHRIVEIGRGSSVAELQVWESMVNIFGVVAEVSDLTL